jgi:hypothetical protein
MAILYYRCKLVVPVKAKSDSKDLLPLNRLVNASILITDSVGVLL